jgi:redox-sensitive bicupin YhaK (pirin superfamily)
MTQSEQQKTNNLFSNPEPGSTIGPHAALTHSADLNLVPHWHQHAGIQILVVTDGVGYYQEKGKARQVLQSGDVIFILPQVSHWHTAACGSIFTDVVIPGEERNELVTWLQQITAD